MIYIKELIRPILLNVIVRAGTCAQQIPVARVFGQNSTGGHMNLIKLDETNEFTAGQMKRFFLVEDSPFFKIINFNLDEGVTFPVHSHDLDGELSILVLQGNGFFLGKDGAEIPARAGDILRSQIREPHGVRASSKMRIIVTIAPPI